MDTKQHKTNHLLCGYCRNNNAKAINDIVNLVSFYYSTMIITDKFSMVDKSLRISPSCDTVSMSKTPPGTKQFAFSDKKFILNKSKYKSLNRIYQWKLKLSVNPHRPGARGRRKHICCGIGICHVSDIAYLLTEPQYLHKRHCQNCALKPRDDFIGFECNLVRRVYSYGKGTTICNCFGPGRDHGHSPCFGIDDTVTISIDCKKRKMIVNSMWKQEQVKSLKNIDNGEYRLAVWLKDAKSKIQIIKFDNFSTKQK